MEPARTRKSRRSRSGGAGARPGAVSFPLVGRLLRPALGVVRCGQCRSLKLTRDLQCPRCGARSRAADIELRVFHLLDRMLRRALAPVAIIIALIVAALVVQAVFLAREQRIEDSRRAVRDGNFP